jgi:hypothetical protein
MSFKTQISQDISSVFINADEFADTHDIDGVPVVCVIDTDILHERSSLVSDAVFGNQIALHVQASAFSEKPVHNQLMRIDDGLFLVREVAENMGMYTLTLESAEE